MERIVLNHVASTGEDDLAPDDAQAHSPMYQGYSTGHSRIYELFESTLNCLGARIEAVTLGLGNTGDLRASLTIAGVLGPLTRPAHTIDAKVLAQRGQLAIEIDERDLRRICPAERDSTPRHDGGDRLGTPVETPDSFRSFIESLDLGQLDRIDDA